MSGSVYAIAAVVLSAGMAVGARADQPETGTKQTPQPQVEPVRLPTVEASKTSPSSQSSTQTTDEAPRVVVHQGGEPADTSDGRVQVGSLKISMASWAAPQAKPDATSSSVGAAKASEPGRAIEVPANTLGPGVPLWRIREREDAEQKLAAAQIDLAQARAEFATRQAGRDRPYSFLGGGYLSSGWYGGRDGFRDGLRGPVTSTVTRFDDLGSTAQRAYSDAAYPRLNGTTDARDAIVRQFGRDATPPIVRIQNEVDAAHRNAHSEHPR
jgi:hypothetical protein